MTCRYCQAKADAFEEAANIAHDGIQNFPYVPSPNTKVLARIYDDLAFLSRLAGEGHHETAHFLRAGAP